MIIELYSFRNGYSPIEEFLDSLDAKTYAKVARSIILVQEYGTNAREPLSKHLEDGLFEIRVRSGNQAVRIIYFFVIDGKIVLTNGFLKKTRKTPKRELELARKYRADYLQRRSNNEDV